MTASARASRFVPRAAIFPFLAGGIVLCHLALGVWAARTHCATFDEPALFAAGLSFWKTGDFRMDPSDPPLGLLWTALPAAATSARLPLDGPEWAGAYSQAFGERLLYWSGNDADRLLFSARAMNLLLSGLLALALWVWMRRRWGDGPACGALALYAFSPTILAHASLATADFPAACATTAAAVALAEFLERPRRGPALAFACAACAAALCKYAAVLIWPAAALLLLFGEDRLRRAKLFLRWAALPAAAFAVAAAAVPRLREGFITRVWQASQGVHPSFLMGRLSDGGWLYYYAVAGAVKSSLPELAVLAALLWLASTRRLKTAASWTAPLGIAAAYFIAASLSRKQIGIRYILPCYALLAVASAPASAWLWRRRRGPALAAALAVWQFAAALGAGPQWISYFNELAGGPSRGRDWLADSNLDWGQDLARLADWSRAAGNPPMILSYFGTASPEYYGLRVQHLRCANAAQVRRINPPDAPVEVLAISVTNLQQVYWRPPAIPAELLNGEPLARVGASILVYDVSRKPELHSWMAGVYAADGDAVLSARERARARRFEMK